MDLDLHGGYPFFLGSISGSSEDATTGPVTRTVPDTIRLDGYTYAIELAQMRFASQDTFRDAVLAGGNPNDSLFNAKGAWARYVYSWHHGSDQEIGDFAEEADPFRFESSDGADPWSQYELSMQRAVVSRRTVSSATPLLIRSADYVFCADGPDLYRTTDLVTWTAMTDPGGDIQAMSTDGTDLYVATTTKVGKYVGSGTTFTAFGTPVTGNVTNVAFGANRLLVGIDNVLKEIGSGGTQTTIRTHFQPAFRWTTIFNIGSRIYVGGYAGSRSELYTLTTDSAGVLVLSNEAAPLPTGELLRTGIPYGGAALLCTSKGVRLTQISGDGTLSYGPLIEDVGDVRCATADGRFAYVGWSVYPRTGDAGVGRMALDTFVNTLQPAYASDVSAVGVTGTVTGVARLNGRTAFAVATGSVYVEEASGAYVTEANLSSGRLYYGTIEAKRLIELDVKFTPLASGEQITATVLNQDGTTVGYGVESNNNATELNVALNGTRVDWAQVVIRLEGDGTTTPQVNGWRMRAFPAPPGVVQWVVPIINHERVVINDGQGQAMAQSPVTIRDRLVALFESKKLVTYSEGDRTYRVRVEGFESQPAKWTDDGSYVQGLFMVQLVSA